MGDYEDYARKNFEDHGPKVNAGKKKEAASGLEEAEAHNAVN